MAKKVWKPTRKQQLAVATQFAGLVGGQLAGLGPAASRFACKFARETFRAIQTDASLDMEDFMEDMKMSRAFQRLPDIDQDKLIELLETFGPLIAALLEGKV